MTQYNLHRGPSSDKGTFGILSHKGEPIALTCEMPWKDNKRAVSCIPKGEYSCVTRVSPKYKKHWHLTNVSGRSFILIHQGNTILDIKGCILVGDLFGTVRGLPAVLNSVKTMNKLRASLPDSFTLIVS